MKKARFLLCAALVFAVFPLAAQKNLPSYEELMAQIQTVPPEYQAVIDADFSDCTETDIIGAFIALAGESGRRDELLAFYGQKAQELDAEVQAALEKDGVSAGDDSYLYKKGDYINQKMHAVFLKYYNKNAFTLAEIADRGLYDCTGATIIYTALLVRHGVPFIPIETSDHVLMKIPLGENEIYVETSSFYGFDPETKKEFQSNFSKSSGYTYASPATGRYYGEISVKQLLALTLQSIAHAHTQKKQYVEAAHSSYILQVLRGDDSGQKSYDSAMNNLASYMVRENNQLLRFEESYKWIAPQPESQNKRAMLNNTYLAAVNDSAKKGDYEKGYADMDLSLKYGFSNKGGEYLRFRLMHTNNTCITLSDKSRFAEAKALLDRELASGVLSKGDLLKLYRSVTVKESNAFYNAQNYKAAIVSTVDCLEKLPGDSVLVNNLKVYYTAYVQSASPAEAKAALLEARKRFPSEKAFMEATGVNLKEM